MAVEWASVNFFLQGLGGRILGARYGVVRS